MSAGPSATTETLAFAGVFIFLGLTWLTFYALVASAAAGWLRRPRVKRIFHAVTGTVLVGVGLRLATRR